MFFQTVLLLLNFLKLFSNCLFSLNSGNAIEKVLNHEVPFLLRTPSCDTEVRLLLTSV